MHTKSSTRKAQTTIIVAMVTASLLLAAPGLQAKSESTASEGWSQWKVMGNGYVARRREPLNMDLPRAERQAANLQTLLPDTLKDRNQANKMSTQSVSVQSLKAGSGATTQAVAKTAKYSKLWLRTDQEGLVAISIADLAAAMNRTERDIRNRAKKGKLNLTTAKNMNTQTANMAVPWYYNKKTDSFMYTAKGYNSFFSNENAYLLSAGGKKALPMEVEDGEVTKKGGSKRAFRDTLKFEEEPDFYYSTWTVAAEPDADYWFWDYLSAGFKDQIEVNLSVPNPASSGRAKLRITMRGWTDLYAGDEHEVWAELNSQPIGTSVVFDGFDEAVLVANFDQSLLDPAGNNTLILHNSYTPGTKPGQWLDQIEIDYRRKPVALDNKLWMHKVVAGTQAVTGFTSKDIVIIQSPGGDAVMRQNARIRADGPGKWKVIFESTGGDDYLVTARSATAIADLTPYKSAKLRSSNNRADYLVIAPREFAQTAQELADYRKNRFGMTKVAWLDDIFYEFSAGRDDPVAVQRFMKHAMKKWKSKPDAVVLVGKSSLDQLNRMGFGDGHLPMAMISTPWALASSDTKLLGYEKGAPFSIGRLPIIHDSEGLLYLAKLDDYESTPFGSEKYEAVLVADNPDKAGDFHLNSDILTTRLLDTLDFDLDLDLDFDLVTLLYHPIDAVRAGLTNSDTWETGYVSYDGHGSTTQIGNNSERFILATDASALTNSVYPIFTALTCAVGDDTLPGTRSLASALVLNPTGGAISSVAPAGLSLDYDAQLLGNALVDALFGEELTIGQALRQAKSDTSDTILEFMPKMYSVVGEPEVYAR